MKKTADKLLNESKNNIMKPKTLEHYKEQKKKLNVYKEKENETASVFSNFLALRS